MATGTLVRSLEKVAQRDPGHVVLIDADRHMTAAELLDRSATAAGALIASGVAPGEVVTWQMPNGIDSAVIHHGILRAGAIPNPVGLGMSDVDLRAILEEARPRILVCPKAWRGRDLLGRGMPVETVDAARILGGSDGPEAAEPDPDAIALLLYTSGTTARPKGVMHSHRGLLAEVRSFEQIHGLTPEDRLLGGAPVTHIAGLAYGLLAPAVIGTSTTFLSRWDARAGLDVIARDRATFMTGPPTFLHTLAEALGGQDVSSFRLFSTGGASIATEQVRAAAARLGCMVKRAYGSTEMPTLTATTCDDDERARVETDGRVIGDAAMRIVGPGGDMPTGEQGEIWARGPELFVGYRSGAPALTDDGWFRTGDLGTVDAEGLLRVTGRLKDIIIRGGENISAAEVEDALLSVPQVADATVVGIPDERLGERVAAVVVPRDPRARLTLTQLTASLRARGLSTHKLPEALYLLESLPRTDSGKVRKDEVRRAILG